MKRGIFAVGSALVPILQEAAERMTSIAVTVSNWVKHKQYKQLFVTAIQVATGVLATDAALVVLRLAVSALGTVFGVISTPAKSWPKIRVQNELRQKLAAHLN